LLCGLLTLRPPAEAARPAVTARFYKT